MYRLPAIVVALAISSSLSGCTKKSLQINPPTTKTDQGSAQEDSSWTIALKTSCSQAAVEKCIGAYGFAVDSEGQYTVGPGPQGQLQAGSISAEELEKIRGEISGILTFNALDISTAANCETREYEYDAESLTLKRFSREQDIINIKDAEYCYRASSIEEAKNIYATISDLAEKYYPIPFPDACLDAVAATHSLYNSIQSCSTDNECVYVNDAYDPITPGTMQFVATDTCSLVAPAVVGNIGLTAANQSKLRSALDQARGACGYRIIRYDCYGPSGFQSTIGGPVCQQGRCRPNPLAESN